MNSIRDEWLNKACMDFVMITQNNGLDKENLFFGPYHLYQDDWEPCAGKIFRYGTLIASWNGYANHMMWYGSEEDKVMLDELRAKAPESNNWVVKSSETLTLDTSMTVPVLNRCSSPTRANNSPIVAVLILLVTFVSILILIIMFGGFNNG